MENKILTQHITDLTTRLQAIDYHSLAISDYNKRYIDSLKPVLGYYMKIYADCLTRGIAATGLSPADITCVDYGGGSGFLSILAKKAGIGKVIYIDLNPLSVKTIHLLKEKSHIGPDIILEGNSDALVDWCKENQIKPQLLIATDLIEHIYDLNPFFADLISINNDIQMFFTTASTPYNPMVKRRLHKMMDLCEKGNPGISNYYELRLKFIQKQYPELSTEQAIQWAKQAKGLIYQDIQKAIESNTPPTLTDKYNTCDPQSGNWTERILPIQAYKSIAAPYNYTVKVSKGFYNTERNSTISSLMCKVVNGIIRFSGKFGLVLAPFIILSFRRK